MDSGAETEGRIPSRQGDVDFQHTTNNKDKFINKINIVGYPSPCK